MLPLFLCSRGVVKGMRLEAKAKDTKKSEAKDSPSKDRHSRGQRQKSLRPRPRTKDTNASVPIKKVFKFFFQATSKKSLQKFFLRDLQKNGLEKLFSANLQNFNHSKNSVVLKPRTGQFSNTLGFETKAKDLTFEAKAKDFKMCSRGRPQGQGRS